jgi:subfamily B ATP-binding cassette protein MsbA
MAGVVAWLNQVEPLRMVTMIAVAIPILFFLKGLFEFWRTFFMTDAAQRVIRDLRQALFDKFVGLSLDYHHKSPTGQTMSRILYDTSIVQNSITEGLADLFFQSFQVVMFLCVILAINWKLSLVICVVIPLLAYPVSRLGKLLKKYSSQTQVVVGQLNSTILEAIEGIQILQAFLVESTAKQKFAAANERAYRLTRKLQKRMTILSPITEFIGACGLAFVFWYGFREVQMNEMTLGTLLTFIAAMASMIRPCKRPS